MFSEGPIFRLTILDAAPILIFSVPEMKLSTVSDNLDLRSRILFLRITLSQLFLFCFVFCFLPVFPETINILRSLENTRQNTVLGGYSLITVPSWTRINRF